ncbi:MAG TPA: hypothetical protein VMV29_04990 [Ktedonobacterales bacterium]|nr:hypothetical protein [Ktedonobacterales bacterium]
MSNDTTYRQKTLRMPGTPRPMRKSAMLPNETQQIMEDFGGSMLEREYVIRRIRKHVPNRFAEQVRAYQRENGEELMTDEEFEETDVRDLMGYISYQGKQVRVVTGCYGDVEVWRIDTTNEWED